MLPLRIPDWQVGWVDKVLQRESTSLLVPLQTSKLAPFLAWEVDPSSTPRQWWPRVQWTPTRSRIDSRPEWTHQLGTLLRPSDLTWVERSSISLDTIPHSSVRASLNYQSAKSSGKKKKTWRSSWPTPPTSPKLQILTWKTNKHQTRPVTKWSPKSSTPTSASSLSQVQIWKKLEWTDSKKSNRSQSELMRSQLTSLMPINFSTSWSTVLGKRSSTPSWIIR